MQRAAKSYTDQESDAEELLSVQFIRQRAETSGGLATMQARTFVLSAVIGARARGHLSRGLRIPPACKAHAMQSCRIRFADCARQQRHCNDSVNLDLNTQHSFESCVL